MKHDHEQKGTPIEKVSTSGSKFFMDHSKKNNSQSFKKTRESGKKETERNETDRNKNDTPKGLKGMVVTQARCVKFKDEQIDGKLCDVYLVESYKKFYQEDQEGCSCSCALF